MWNGLIVAAIAAVLIGGGFWIADGMQMLSKDRIATTIEVVDPLFNTTTTETKYEDGFLFGLLPLDDTIATVPKSYAFVLGASAGAIVFSLFMKRRARRKTS
jgi:hypothetical protein